MNSKTQLSTWGQSRLATLLSPPVLRGIWQRHGIWNTLLWLLLVPFSLGFSLIVRGRNLLYDLGVLPCTRLDATVVSVGNLTVGGTGKTPIVLWLARALQARGHRVGILTRGYKGKRTNDLVVVGTGGKPLTAPTEVGDEAVMLAREFSGVVIAGKDRIAAARLAQKNFGVDIVILDDGFQHRRLARDMDILLVNVSQDISSHWLLPAGPLRESFYALRRAHAIILTKRTISARASRVRLRSWLPTASVPIFSGRLVPTALVSSLQRQRQELPLTFLGSKRVVAVCGIADPLPFYRALREWEAEIAEVFEFPDHHAYTHADWQMISLTAQKFDLIVTTEKDLVKLERFPFAAGKLVALQVRMDITPAEQLLAMIERRAARKKGHEIYHGSTVSH